jgi:uncharacterized membrane protein YcaP (DUF421 family)
MEKFLFDSWESLLRVAVAGVCSYISLVLVLRLIGNRTLSQLNAFDLIVTVALGSTLATVILNKSLPLVDGLFALTLLVLLQYGVSWLSLRHKRLRQVIKKEPRLLFFKGRYLRSALRSSRITEDEVLQMIRSEGIGSLRDVDAVVLETNGRFSVIRKLNESSDESVLSNVVREE